MEEPGISTDRLDPQRAQRGDDVAPRMSKEAVSRARLSPT